MHMITSLIVFVQFLAVVIGSRSFQIDFENNRFLKDGQPFQYVSGSIHYFRSTEQQWEDLLNKCRLGGLNTITTYVAWNLHQETPALEFNYSGNRNLFRFIELAQKHGLLVILRPGPYIDSERDMGGLPAWLLWQKQGIKLRTSDLEYTYFVSRWFDELLPKLIPYLYENGGPVIMMQVENEYGSYACDKEYTGFLRDLIYRHLGQSLVLFTTDGPSDGMLKCGSIEGVYSSVDFGPESPKEINGSFAEMRKYSPKGPLINSEFYPGWIDHWQKPHSKVPSSEVASALDTLLALGANVNIYIYHGGTSFGFGSGANVDGGMYDPNPTSYDFDAPLSEAGDPTEKYFAIKKTIAKYMTVPEENPVVAKKLAYGKVQLKRLTNLHSKQFKLLFGSPHKESSVPLSFEDLQQANGFVLYKTQIDFITSDPVLLHVPELRDRGYVYVNKVFQGIISRQESIYSIPIRARQNDWLEVLVENQGRICYGGGIDESKGLGKNVSLGGKQLLNWTNIAMEHLAGRKLSKYSQTMMQNGEADEFDITLDIRNAGAGSVFVGNLTLKPDVKPLDTFVNLDGFSKGMVWVNRFNLGRYWPIVGPQVTLYLPGVILKPYPAVNEFILFELEQAPDSCYHTTNATSCCIDLTDTHIIDKPTPFKAINLLFKKE